jgi:hypothetical protein
MLIYIDTDSGTWGVGEDNLVIIEMTPEEGERFYEWSDSEIIAYAKARA